LAKIIKKAEFKYNYRTCTKAALKLLCLSGIIQLK